jgi:hypothetical protein
MNPPLLITTNYEIFKIVKENPNLFCIKISYENSGNACSYSVQNILSSPLILKNCNFASGAEWVRNLVSHFEGGT